MKNLKLILIVCFTLFFLSCESLSTDASSSDSILKSIDNFENENFWIPLGLSCSNDYSTETELSEEWATEGSFCGEWSFSKIPENEKASFCYESLPFSDFQNAKAIILDIFNMGQYPLKTFLEIQCENKTYKTKEVFVGIGENINLYYEIQDDISNELKNVKSIAFLVCGKAYASELFIDNLNVIFEQSH